MFQAPTVSSIEKKTNWQIVVGKERTDWHWHWHWHETETDSAGGVRTTDTNHQKVSMKPCQSISQVIKAVMAEGFIGHPEVLLDKTTTEFTRSSGYSRGQYILVMLLSFRMGEGLNVGPKPRRLEIQTRRTNVGGRYSEVRASRESRCGTSQLLHNY